MRELFYYEDIKAVQDKLKSQIGSADLTALVLKDELYDYGSNGNPDNEIYGGLLGALEKDEGIRRKVLLEAVRLFQRVDYQEEFFEDCENRRSFANGVFRLLLLYTVKEHTTKRGIIAGGRFTKTIFKSFFETFGEYISLINQREIGNTHNHCTIGNCKIWKERGYKTSIDLKARISPMRLWELLKIMGNYGLKNKCLDKKNILSVIRCIVEDYLMEKAAKKPKKNALVDMVVSGNIRSNSFRGIGLFKI